MNAGKLVFAQIMEHLPLTTFRRCAARYDGEHQVKLFSCLDQYLCMAFSQLTYRESLRDIGIPAALNLFLDRHGVVDADYEDALALEKSIWVISPHRQVVPWPGRYLVIVDSASTERPVWSPLPVRPGSARGRSPREQS